MWYFLYRYVPSVRYTICMEESAAQKDVFNHMSYQEVLRTHLPDGVLRVPVAPSDLPPLDIEMARAVPGGSDTQHHTREFVQLPGFPNNLVDKGRTTEHIGQTVAPNRHLLRAAALAKATGRPVRAFGFPGGPNADTLPHALRDQVTDGDYSGLVRYYATALAESGVTEVDIDGYSLGGAMTPDFCMACADLGIQVKSIFWGAVANVAHTDGLGGLAKRFLSIGDQEDYDRYAEASVALSQEAERHKKEAKDLGRTAVVAMLEDKVVPIAKKFGGLLTPTQFAMGRSIVYGKWLEGPLEEGMRSPAQKMKEFLGRSPETKLHMYVGSKDALAPLANMQALADELQTQLTVFEDRNHSIRDDLPFMQRYITEHLSA